MANQGPARRQVLEMLAKASLASQFPGFCRWAFAGEPQHEHENAGSVAPPGPASYAPQYFSPAEYRTLDVLTELIIPRDESPGAHDAGVVEFIDFMAAHGEEAIRQPMRDGLAWLDTQAQTEGGSNFAGLAPGRQNAILKAVAFKNSAVAADVKGQVFFQLIRRYTVMGYYTSRVGMQELDFPGLKFYTQSPACPHKDDPEHRHLPPPRF